MAEEKKKKKKKRHRGFWAFIRFQIFILICVGGATAYYYFGGYADQVKELKKEAEAIVEASQESDFVPSQTLSVYGSDGSLISQKKGTKEAEYVRYEDIPSIYFDAITSIEDKKFYSHHGVDIKAILRAVKAMVLNGEATQGGSTITMQLAKLIYMDASSKDWQYKVEQMFIAVGLENKYSKNKIMEFYLNNIYFANGYYGISAAAHGYFDCDISELSTSQVAFLLAIPNSPTYYDPVANIDHTLTRRNRILENMYDDGKLTDEEYYAALRESIALNRPEETEGLWCNSVDTYVFYCATRALMKANGFTFRYYFDSDEEEQAYDEEYDELYTIYQKELYTEGYSVYTTIDMDKQNVLQECVDMELADYTDTDSDGVYDMQSAAVCIDNNSGMVVAIVGGRSQDFSFYTLNRAYQSHRQPGSSIKPLLVYTPLFGLGLGYTPDSEVTDQYLEDGPKNAGDYYYGDVSIRFAVQESLNTVAWQMYDIVTPEVGLQYLKNMNFSAIVDNDYVPATSIGGFTNGVSALEMAAGYATIENDGMYREPDCIVKIVDGEQNVIYQHEAAEAVIYGETASRMMTSVLQSVISDGTGKGLALDDDMPCAGKTGTTNEKKDGWFVGYTRYYTTAVWVGCDIPKTVDGLSGSTYPGHIWQSFMNRIHEGMTKLDFLPYAQLSDEFEAEEETPQEESPGDDDDDGDDDDGDDDDDDDDDGGNDDGGDDDDGGDGGNDDGGDDADDGGDDADGE